MVGLVGADHVKFQDGIVGRYGRMAKGERDNISVLLNPTLIDTRPSGSVSMAANDSSGADQITLQVRYLKEGWILLVLNEDCLKVQAVFCLLLITLS